MKDNRSRLQLYGAALKRLAMWQLLVKPLNLFLVTEFPKSGASWFCQMVADATGLPFPRNVSPKFEQCIMHGHHLFNPSMGKAIAVLRDGRDVMVSAYFHFLFENDRNTSRGVQYHRSKLRFDDYNSVQDNLPRFIEYMFDEYAKKNMLHFSWSDFVDNIFKHAPYLYVVKYENLLINPVSSLKGALEFYNLSIPDDFTLTQIAEKYSFRSITKRNPGEEDPNSFIRKGISGDWKNYFSLESCEAFKHYAGKSLITAGYETDLSWN